jgi:hypothetical protein
VRGYREFLRAQTNNQKRLTKSVQTREYRPPTAPQYQSAGEQEQDLPALRNRALANLREILPTGSDALTALQPLRDADVQSLVRDWEGFKRTVGPQDLISPSYFAQLWSRYKMLTSGRRPPLPPVALLSPSPPPFLPRPLPASPPTVTTVRRPKPPPFVMPRAPPASPPTVTVVRRPRPARPTPSVVAKPPSPRRRLTPSEGRDTVEFDWWAVSTRPSNVPQPRYQPRRPIRPPTQLRRDRRGFDEVSGYDWWSVPTR